MLQRRREGMLWGASSFSTSGNLCSLICSQLSHHEACGAQVKASHVSAFRLAKLSCPRVPRRNRTRPRPRRAGLLLRSLRRQPASRHQRTLWAHRLRCRHSPTGNIHRSTTSSGGRPLPELPQLLRPPCPPCHPCPLRRTCQRQRRKSFSA